jgi:hypothetical protein
MAIDSGDVKIGILAELQGACELMAEDPLFRAALRELQDPSGATVEGTILTWRDQDEQRHHLGYFDCQGFHRRGVFSGRTDNALGSELPSIYERRDQAERVLKGVLGSFTGKAWEVPIPYVFDTGPGTCDAEPGLLKACDVLSTWEHLTRGPDMEGERELWQYSMLLGLNGPVRVPGGTKSPTISFAEFDCDCCDVKLWPPDVPIEAVSDVSETLTKNWAECSKRRNAIEFALRGVIKDGLLYSLGSNKAAPALYRSLPEARREKLSRFGYEEVWQELFLLELISVMSANWSSFDKKFSNVTKEQFLQMLQTINDNRVDAHARPLDDDSRGWLRYCFRTMEELLGLPHHRESEI